MTDTEYQTDNKNNVIDPPVLPEYEAQLRAAHDAGDQDGIDRIQDAYTKARDDVAKKSKPASRSNTPKKAK